MDWRPCLAIEVTNDGAVAHNPDIIGAGAPNGAQGPRLLELHRTPTSTIPVQQRRSVVGHRRDALATGDVASAIRDDPNIGGRAAPNGDEVRVRPAPLVDVAKCRRRSARVGSSKNRRRATLTAAGRSTVVDGTSNADGRDAALGARGCAAPRRRLATSAVRWLGIPNLERGAASTTKLRR